MCVRAILVLYRDAARCGNTCMTRAVLDVALGSAKTSLRNSLEPLRDVWSISADGH